MTNWATNRLEMEQLGRETLLVLFRGLNDSISSQTWWEDRDAEFYSELGRPRTITVEPVLPENFYPGHVPSLIEAPIERYPNCAVYAFTATPLGSDDDDADQFDVRVAVEIMCKSVTDEEEVNARMHRTLEAAHQCLTDPGARWLTGYTSSRLYNTPNTSTGEVFVRRQADSRGDRWFWQGGRLEYRIERYVAYD